MQYVLFDLDGTIVNSSEGIFRSFYYALDKQGVPHPDGETMKSFIGPPLYDSFLRVHHGDEKLAEEGVRLYRERYSVTGYQECHLYEGCKECLSALVAAGKKVALATSKPKIFADRILRLHGIDGYFTASVGSQLDYSLSGKAGIVRAAMDALSAVREETVMVGDRKQDGEGAKANGVTFVGFRGGFEKKGELEEAGAGYIAENYQKLQKYLLG